MLLLERSCMSLSFCRSCPQPASIIFFPLEVIPILVGRHVAEALPRILALLRRHLLVLLADRAPLLLGQLPVPFGALTDLLLLIGREFLEFIITLADRLFALGRQLAPFLISLIGLHALGRRHALPAVGALPDAVLALRRHAVPAILERLQGLLFPRGEPVPGSATGLTPGKPREKQDDHRHE